VLADLRRKVARLPNARLNLVLFRLAAYCGLRVSEITSLHIGDVRTEHARPHLRIRRGAAKGGRPRTVPLWWDRGTLDDLAAWKANTIGRERRGLRSDPASRVSHRTYVKFGKLPSGVGSILVNVYRPSRPDGHEVRRERRRKSKSARDNGFDGC
jgi:integrase